MTSLRKQIRPEIRNARKTTATIGSLATWTNDTSSKMKFTEILSVARRQWRVTARKSSPNNLMNPPSPLREGFLLPEGNVK